MVYAISAQALPDAEPPRVSVGWVWDTAATVTVVRQDPDRARPVRGAEALVMAANSGATFEDYEAPFGVPVTYLVHDQSGNSAVTGQVTLDPSAFYPNDQDWSTERGAVWLRHLTIPKLSMPVDLSNAESPSFKQTRTVVDVLNRREPIVLADAKRKAFTSTLDIRTWSLAEAARLRKLLADNSVLLLTVPAAEHWGLTNHYIAVGDVTEERLWQEWAPFEGRVFHLPVEIVERPAGGEVYGSCCYFTEQEDLVSYHQFDARYPTYAGLSACDVFAQAPPDPPDPPPYVPAGEAPPDPTFHELTRLSQIDNQGTYGSRTSSTTYGSKTFYNINQSTQNLSAASLPRQVVILGLTLTGGNKYVIEGQAQGFRADTAGTMALQTRVTPGSSATAGSGTALHTAASGTFSAGGTANMSNNSGSPAGGEVSFIPPSTGTYCFALVITGTVASISDTPGAGGTYATMAVYERVANVSTTIVPASRVVISAPLTASEGTEYQVAAEVSLTNAAEFTQVGLRYAPGSDPAPGDGMIASGTGVAAIPGTQTFTLSAFIGPELDGDYTVFVSVESDEPVTDATDGDHPRTLQIGYFE